MDPGHEREVRERAPVPNQVVGVAQRGVEHHGDAADLCAVARDGGRQGFGVRVREPYRLPEIGPLARRLEVQPLARVVLFGEARERERVLAAVVLLDQVFDDRAGFPER